MTQDKKCFLNRTHKTTTKENINKFDYINI